METFFTPTQDVHCDGGEGPLGHPRVFLHVDAQGEITCPYCSRHFVLDENPEDQHAA